MTASKPHQELVKTVRRGIPKEGRDALNRWMPSTPSVRSVREASAALASLEEQVQSLELACDHHKMFWQKAEERERGLKEQLETLRKCVEEYADLDNWENVRSPETTSAWQKRWGHPTPWVDAAEALMLVSNPASELEKA